MRVAEQPAFGHTDRERIYHHVESRGAVEPAAVRDALGLDPGGFRHHVAIMRRDGLLEEVDGTLRVSLETGTAEEHRDGDLAFTVRPARQEDLGGIVGAIRQVAEQGSYIEAESVAQEVDRDSVLLRHNECESRVFFVGCVEDEVVGWVHLRVPELEKLSHTAELTVGVLEEYRGDGIGSHLLARGLEWAAENGFERVYNNVPATNERAIEFLRDSGWEVEAVRAGHYRIDGEYVDEVMMAVEL